ncbi:MAG: hypothetical protein AAF570_13770 [Bacteroidota bacterium]
MRYFEYIYAVVAVGLVAFLASNAKYMTTMNYIAVIIGILISSFMFTFRRNQRMLFEAEERKRIAELEAEAYDDEDWEDEDPEAYEASEEGEDSESDSPELVNEHPQDEH